MNRSVCKIDPILQLRVHFSVITNFTEMIECTKQVYGIILERKGNNIHCLII